MKKYLAFAVGVLAVLGGGYTLYQWQQNPAQLYVVNVLDRELFDECHIQGSINVPFPRVKSWARSIPKESTIVFYCSNYMCSASGQAARMLAQRGFEHVYAYEAGMYEWYHENLPVNCKKESSYLAADNPKSAIHDATIAVISTDELKNMMKKRGFFR